MFNNVIKNKYFKLFPVIGGFTLILLAALVVGTSFKPQATPEVKSAVTTKNTTTLNSTEDNIPTPTGTAKPETTSQNSTKTTPTPVTTTPSTTNSTTTTYTYPVYVYPTSTNPTITSTPTPTQATPTPKSQASCNLDKQSDDAFYHSLYDPYLASYNTAKTDLARTWAERGLSVNDSAFAQALAQLATQYQPHLDYLTNNYQNQINALVAQGCVF